MDYLFQVFKLESSDTADMDDNIFEEMKKDIKIPESQGKCYY